MTEKRRNHYEGMFLFGQSAIADLAGAADHVREILGRAGAELIAMRKWDERRLAFEIKKHKRGVFLLTYFTCDASQMASIERDCNLSEQVLRVLVIRADHLTPEEMKSADGQRELADEAALRRERADRPADNESDSREAAGVGAGDDDADEA